MRNTPRWSGTLLVALILAACDQTPVEPNFQADPQENVVAASAVLDSWDLLVSAEEIQLAALDAVSAGPSSPAADALFFEAGSLETDAIAAEQAGESQVAETLSSWASAAYLEAALAVFGTQVATETVSNVEAAISHVEAAVDGSPQSPDVRSSVDRARDLADRARSGLSRGDDAAALRDGIAAADALRDLRPEDRAKHFVALALRLLEKAKELVGPDTRPEVLEILRTAEAHCDAAVRAIESGHWQIALAEAQKCAALSRRVIAILSGGVPDDRLEQHAIAVVDHAADLLGRAIALAGDDPPPEIKRALDEASDYLRKAREALADEDWREAIRLGHESASISKRVIGFLTDDRPSDGLQARAEHAVQHAKALFGRAEALAGDDPRPDVVAHLAKARELIAEADTALAEESWRRAIAKAEEASRVLYHLIRLLS